MSKRDMLEQNSAARLRTMRETKLDMRPVIGSLDRQMAQYFLAAPPGVYGPNSHLPILTSDVWVIRRYHSPEVGPRELTQLIGIDQVHELKECDIFAYYGKRLQDDYRVEETDKGVFLHASRRNRNEKLVIPRTWTRNTLPLYGGENETLPYRATEFMLCLLRNSLEEVLTIPNGFNPDEINDHINPIYKTEEVVKLGKQCLDDYFRRFYAKNTEEFLDSVVDKFYTHMHTLSIHSGFLSILMGIDYYALEFFKLKDIEEAQKEWAEES
jgi:hypothetical protein